MHEFTYTTDYRKNLTEYWQGFFPKYNIPLTKPAVIQTTFLNKYAIRTRF